MFLDFRQSFVILHMSSHSQKQSGQKSATKKLFCAVRATVAHSPHLILFKHHTIAQRPRNCLEGWTSAAAAAGIASQKRPARFFSVQCLHIKTCAIELKKSHVPRAVIQKFSCVDFLHMLHCHTASNFRNTLPFVPRPTFEILYGRKIPFTFIISFFF